MQKKPKHVITIRSAAAEYLTSVSTIGNQPGSVELRYEDENIWLTQRLMAELYGVDVRTISYHIKKILEDHELDEHSVIRKYWITASDGRERVREVPHRARPTLPKRLRPLPPTRTIREGITL